MSKKNRSNQVFTILFILLVVTAAAVFLYVRNAAPSSQDDDPARQAALASEDAPSIGDANAKVHIVEFLDPACETCAIFFPMVKDWMSQVPGQIRLSVRHVAFHDGAEYAVRVLEASRNQGKYWETLEAMLATQRQWTEHHTVLPERIGPAIASVGLDMDQLMADMNSDEVTRRIAKDKADSITLGVSATPDYHVNGRPLPSFGRQQLADLVREELER